MMVEFDHPAFLSPVLVEMAVVLYGYWIDLLDETMNSPSVSTALYKCSLAEEH